MVNITAPKQYENFGLTKYHSIPMEETLPVNESVTRSPNHSKSNKL